MNLPRPVFAHLGLLTDERGLWEHAEFSHPRREGYTTDDVARALIVVAAETNRTEDLDRVTRVYLRFLGRAIRSDGRVRNRMDARGRWTEQVGSDDSHGRMIWSLGVVARDGFAPWVRDEAAALAERVAPVQSGHLRPHAFALLGACELLGSKSSSAWTLDVVKGGVGMVDRPGSPNWLWPEPRLTYDNGRMPAAIIESGRKLGDVGLLERGLRLLEWLVEVESRPGHFSFAAVGGWATGETRPGFDQQPVEAWAMADACFRAWQATEEERWVEAVDRAARWFFGANDLGETLYDAESGACCDGLGPSWVNRNQGAESTISALATLQLWHELQAARAASSAGSDTTAAPTARSAAPYVR